MSELWRLFRLFIAWLFRRGGDDDPETSWLDRLVLDA